MDDLWPDELDDATVRAPVTLLREQAVLLGKKTSNLIEAEVELGSNVDGNFTYHFFIVAPTLNNYHYRLFSVEHTIALYPVLIDVGEELGKELGMPAQVQQARNYIEQAHLENVRFMQSAGLLSAPSPRHSLVAQTEEAFVNTLKAILGSKFTRRVITALRAQFNMTEQLQPA